MKTNFDLRFTTTFFFGAFPDEIGVRQLRKIAKHLNAQPEYFTIHNSQTRTFKKNLLVRLYYNSIIEKEKGCWYRNDWSVYRTFDKQPAHRVSYELFHGPRKPGMFICHHCDRPGCINPYHLFEGTHIDNLNDMAIKGRGPMPTDPERLMQIIRLMSK